MNNMNPFGINNIGVNQMDINNIGMNPFGINNIGMNPMGINNQSNLMNGIVMDKTAQNIKNIKYNTAI